jgi:bacterial/archaeal transporter family protein
VRGWLFYSVLSVLIWGVWGAVPKATSDALSPQLMQVICTVGLVPVALLFTFSQDWRKGNNLLQGTTYAFLTGLCGSVGNLALLAALKRGGEASAVLPLTGMYPLVTVVLARIFLKERMNRIQSLGIGMALLAIYFFSTEGGTTSVNPLLPWWRNSISVWMAYSLCALLLYGVAGITQKLATNEISSQLSTVCFAAAFVPVAGAILLIQPLKWNISGKDWSLAIFYGALMGFAMLAQFAAYSRGKASIVTAVTALYPALTVVLAVPLFREQLNARKLVAIVLALAAGVALSYEAPGSPSWQET